MFFNLNPITVTITLRWDAKQFEIIQRLLSGDDRAQAAELTGDLKQSESGLRDAIAKTSI